MNEIQIKNTDIQCKSSTLNHGSCQISLASAAPQYAVKHEAVVESMGYYYYDYDYSSTYTGSYH